MEVLGPQLLFRADDNALAPLHEPVGAEELAQLLEELGTPADEQRVARVQKHHHLRGHLRQGLQQPSLSVSGLPAPHTCRHQAAHPEGHAQLCGASIQHVRVLERLAAARKAVVVQQELKGRWRSMRASGLPPSGRASACRIGERGLSHAAHAPRTVGLEQPVADATQLGLRTVELVMEKLPREKGAPLGKLHCVAPELPAVLHGGSAR